MIPPSSSTAAAPSNSSAAAAATNAQQPSNSIKVKVNNATLDSSLLPRAASHGGASYPSLSSAGQVSGSGAVPLRDGKEASGGRVEQGSVNNKRQQAMKSALEKAADVESSSTNGSTPPASSADDRSTESSVRQSPTESHASSTGLTAHQDSIVQSAAVPSSSSPRPVQRPRKSQSGGPRRNGVSSDGQTNETQQSPRSQQPQQQPSRQRRSPTNGQYSNSNSMQRPLSGSQLRSYNGNGHQQQQQQQQTAYYNRQASGYNGAQQQQPYRPQQQPPNFQPHQSPPRVVSGQTLPQRFNQHALPEQTAGYPQQQFYNMHPQHQLHPNAPPPYMHAQQQQLFALQQQLNAMTLQQQQQPMQHPNMPQQQSPLHGAPTTAINSPRTSLATSTPLPLSAAQSRQHSGGGSGVSPLLPAPAAALPPTQSQPPQHLMQPQPPAPPHISQIHSQSTPTPLQHQPAPQLPAQAFNQPWVWNHQYQMLMPSGLQLPPQPAGNAAVAGGFVSPQQLAAYYQQQQALLMQQQQAAAMPAHQQHHRANAPRYNPQQQQQPLGYPHPQAPPMQYNQPPPQQPPQPSAVLPVAKYPHITTSFPPQGLVELPSFTHLVIPPDAATAAHRHLPANTREPPFYSIDVECVATGKGHNDRTIASIAVVDSNELVVLNVYIQPTEPIVSCLTGLTGITPQQLERGIPLADALALVRAVIPPHALIVGQNVLKDIQWLGLEEGVDFAGMADLTGVWRAFNNEYKSFSVFSLSHEAKALLGVLQSEPHHAVDDALLSVKLYRLWKQLSAPSEKANLAKAHELLLQLPVESSFAKRNPTLDGVCMGNKKSCSCGSPFLF